jgi:hypothetical protein
MILIAAFHKRKIIAWQFLPRNVMVNYANYLEFLENRLHPEVRKVRIHRPLILHDNATPHKQPAVKDFFNRHRWRVLRHPLQPRFKPPGHRWFHKNKAAT